MILFNEMNHWCVGAMAIFMDSLSTDVINTITQIFFISFVIIIEKISTTEATDWINKYFSLLSSSIFLFLMMVEKANVLISSSIQMTNIDMELNNNTKEMIMPLLKIRSDLILKVANLLFEDL